MVFFLAYYASLRVKHTLSIAKVSFSVVKAELKAVLSLPSFKGSKRPVEIMNLSSENSSMCTVSALLDHLKVSTTALINGKIKFYAELSKLKPENCSSHSIREGRTTDLVELNCGDATIKESGG